MLNKICPIVISIWRRYNRISKSIHENETEKSNLDFIKCVYNNHNNIIWTFCANGIYMFNGFYYGSAQM